MRKCTAEGVAISRLMAELRCSARSSTPTLSKAWDGGGSERLASAVCGIARAAIARPVLRAALLLRGSHRPSGHPR
eukprot:scaffold12184_cov114-Isochrysis_galbana.AAC.4